MLRGRVLKCSISDTSDSGSKHAIVRAEEEEHVLNSTGEIWPASPSLGTRTTLRTFQIQRFPSRVEVNPIESCSMVPPVLALSLLVACQGKHFDATATGSLSCKLLLEFAGTGRIQALVS